MIVRLPQDRDRRDARAGVALLTSVFVLTVVSFIVIAGSLVSDQQLRAGRAALARGASLYAAEAGLSVARARSDSVSIEGLQPGETRALGSGDLTPLVGYRTWITRLDDGTDDGAAYYLIRAVGISRGPTPGRRQLGLLARSAWAPDPADCGADAADAAFSDTTRAKDRSGREIGHGAGRPDCPAVGLPDGRRLMFPLPLAQRAWLEIFK